MSNSTQHFSYLKTGVFCINIELLSLLLVTPLRMLSKPVNYGCILYIWNCSVRICGEQKVQYTYA